MLATKPPTRVVLAVPVKPNLTPAGAAELTVVLPRRVVTNGAATLAWNPVVQSTS